jgi:hypothetical protein
MSEIPIQKNVANLMTIILITRGMWGLLVQEKINGDRMRNDTFGW